MSSQNDRKTIEYLFALKILLMLLLSLLALLFLNTAKVNALSLDSPLRPLSLEPSTLLDKSLGPVENNLNQILEAVPVVQNLDVEKINEQISEVSTQESINPASPDIAPSTTPLSSRENFPTERVQTDKPAVQLRPMENRDSSLYAALYKFSNTNKDEYPIGLAETGSVNKLILLLCALLPAVAFLFTKTEHE